MRLGRYFGIYDGGKLAAMVVSDKAALARLEAIIHPLDTD